MTALDVFNSQAKRGSDPQVTEFFDILALSGNAGKLAEFLLLSQKSHDRLQRVYRNEIVDPQYEKLMHSRCDFNINRVYEFALLHMAELKIKVKRFPHMVRIKIAIDNQRIYLRFRHKGNIWMGDDSNLTPICTYCDLLLQSVDISCAKCGTRLPRISAITDEDIDGTVWFYCSKDCCEAH